MGSCHRRIHHIFIPAMDKMIYHGFLRCFVITLFILAIAIFFQCNMFYFIEEFFLINQII